MAGVTRKPFNDIPLREDEVLAPLVIDGDFRDYLKTLGLNWDNAETWHFPRCGEGVPVCFFPVKKEEFEQSISLFNDQVSRYLKRFQKSEEDETLSLEAFHEAIDDDDSAGFDPTGTTEHEDNFMLELAFKLLVEELNKQDPDYGRVITMLRDGCFLLPEGINIFVTRPMPLTILSTHPLTFNIPVNTTYPPSTTSDGK